MDIPSDKLFFYELLVKGSFINDSFMENFSIW